MGIALRLLGDPQETKKGAEDVGKSVFDNEGAQGSASGNT